MHRALSTNVIIGFIMVGCGGGGRAAAPPTAAAEEASKPVPARDAAAAVTTKIRLPADESPHSEPVEWWYYTGLLSTASQHSYGFELVVFQAMMGGDSPAYMAHFGVTDRHTGKFHLATRSGLEDQRRAAPGFDLDVAGWRVMGHDGSDRISAAMDGYAIDLALAAAKPVVYQYGDGEMTIGSDKPFFYYSYPRMTVTGELVVAGVSEKVTGSAWMDHQWGAMGQAFDGWDWFSLRLDDNTEVMLFRVRRKEEFVGGTFVAADGTIRELVADDVDIEPTGEWLSPHTKAKYPHGWNIRVAALGIDVAVTPVIADQEFYLRLFHSPVYWEGLCEVSGKRGDQQVGGHAYVELVGY